MSLELVSKRFVHPFVSYDEAVADRRNRADTILFDLHGLWWSVPMELTIHEVNDQVLEVIRTAELAEFPNAAVRLAREDWPT